MSYNVLFVFNHAGFRYSVVIGYKNIGASSATESPSFGLGCMKLFVYVVFALRISLWFWCIEELCHK